MEDYNTGKKKVFLIVFDDMIVDMESNEKLSPVITELFLRLNITHYFIMKVPNKRERQRITLDHSSNIDIKDFKKLILKNHFHF